MAHGKLYRAGAERRAARIFSGIGSPCADAGLRPLRAASRRHVYRSCDRGREGVDTRSGTRGEPERRRVRQLDRPACERAARSYGQGRRGGGMNQMVFREDSALVSQVLWSRLRALMNEAGATLKRTAFSFPTRESTDFAPVLMD